MGGAQSSNGAGRTEDNEVKSLESKLRGTGDLTTLERAFSHLKASSSEPSSPSSVSLQELEDSFGLAPIYVHEKRYPGLSKVVSGIGPALVREFFGTEEQKINWAHLLQGFEKCSQISGANGLRSLLAVYIRAADAFAPGTSSAKGVDKISGPGASYDVTGFLTGVQLREFLWLCWLLMCYNRLPKNVTTTKFEVSPPEIDFLISAAVKVCHGSKGDFSGHGSLEKEMSLPEITSWVLLTIPRLSGCLVQFVRGKLERLPMKSRKSEICTGSGKPGSEDLDEVAVKVEEAQEAEEVEPQEAAEKYKLLLQSGVAWAIGLSLGDYASSDILFTAACGLFSSQESEYPNLIYRSSTHGRGMNRFWACAQGYRGLTLFLIMGRTAEQAEEDVSQGETFLIGGLIPGGFDNKGSFYGASGSCLFAMDPVFLPIRSIGREKNFVYSYKNIHGAAYRSQPKPEGVGFGGTSGKERIWIDEEYRTLTVRHHAVDKTYHAGSLAPNQGYAPVVVKIVDLEVWGLGGKSAQQDQTRFLQRENLFTEQRRKVDLKKMFGTWQNSPEKMMMDMVSDPNAPGREER